MPAFEYDFTSQNAHQMEQGSLFTARFQFYTDENEATPENFTGKTAKMQVRSSPSATTPLIELTTEGPAGRKITLGGAQGTLDIDIDSVTMASLKAPFKGVYDLKLIHSATIQERLMEGAVEITPEVTR